MFGRLMFGVSAIGIGLAAYNITTVITTTPAFAEAERVEGVSGTWRLRTSSALYDRSEYLFQLGYGFLNGDLRDLNRGQALGDLSSLEVAEARTLKAIDLFEESLELSPGNAHAWAALAQANLAAGDLATALDATRTSWALAPHNGTLSMTRLRVVEGILELKDEAELFGLTDVDPVQISEEDISRANVDYKVAATHRKRQLGLFLETSLYVGEIMTAETLATEG